MNQIQATVRQWRAQANKLDATHTSFDELYTEMFYSQKGVLAIDKQLKALGNPPFYWCAPETSTRDDVLACLGFLEGYLNPIAPASPDIS